MKVLVEGNNNHYTDTNVEVEVETETDFSTIKSQQGFVAKHFEHRNFDIKEKEINMGFIVEANPFSDEVQRLND